MKRIVSIKWMNLTELQWMLCFLNLIRIDDMEAGRIFPVEDAFRMIEDMLDKETNQE